MFEKAFNRWRLKRLVKIMTETALIVSVVPNVEIRGPLSMLFGQKVLVSLLERNYSVTSRDPIMIKAIKKLLSVRSKNFFNDIVDLLEENNLGVYTREKCACGAGLYSLKGDRFCLECYIKHLKDIKESNRHEKYSGGSIPDLPTVQESTGEENNLDPSTLQQTPQG